MPPSIIQQIRSWFYSNGYRCVQTERVSQYGTLEYWEGKKNYSLYVNDEGDDYVLTLRVPVFGGNPLVNLARLEKE